MQSNITSITNQAPVLCTKFTMALTLFCQVMSISTFGHQIPNADIFNLSVLWSNLTYGQTIARTNSNCETFFFLGEGGKKCGKLQLAVGKLTSVTTCVYQLHPTPFFASTAWMQVVQIIHPAGQHPPCKHYTFRSNVAEEHQSYASILCCIA